MLGVVNVTVHGAHIVCARAEDGSQKKALFFLTFRTTSPVTERKIRKKNVCVSEKCFESSSRSRTSLTAGLADQSVT